MCLRWEFMTAIIASIRHSAQCDCVLLRGMKSFDSNYDTLRDINCDELWGRGPTDVKTLSLTFPLGRTAKKLIIQITR